MKFRYLYNLLAVLKPLWLQDVWTKSKSNFFTDYNYTKTSSIAEFRFLFTLVRFIEERKESILALSLFVCVSIPRWVAIWGLLTSNLEGRLLRPPRYWLYSFWRRINAMPPQSLMSQKRGFWNKYREWPGQPSYFAWEKYQIFEFRTTEFPFQKPAEVDQNSRPGKHWRRRIDRRIFGLASCWFCVRTTSPDGGHVRRRFCQPRRWKRNWMRFGASHHLDWKNLINLPKKRSNFE